MAHNYVIEKHDKVCWNCELFIRDVNSYYGYCAFRDIKRKNSETACKIYEERIEDDYESEVDETWTN